MAIVGGRGGGNIQALRSFISIEHGLDLWSCMTAKALIFYQAPRALLVSAGLSSTPLREGKAVGEDGGRRWEKLSTTRWHQDDALRTALGGGWEAEGSPTRVAVTTNGRTRHCHE